MFEKKKGFTLIELLAVIVILAVIALIATPLIMNVINDAKKNSFKDSAYGIIKAVELRVTKEQMNQIDGQNIAYKVDVASDAIHYNGDKPESGWASIDVDGKVTLYMKNGSYCAYAVNGGDVTITTNPSDCDTNISAIQNNTELSILDSDEGDKPAGSCTFNGELTQGAEYVKGQYTYRYKQEYDSSGWNSFNTDGWGVTLTDKNSTDPVTSELCTTINEKPVVSMQAMFRGSKASSIDLSSFDTSKVTNMSAMFMAMTGLTTIDLSGFDTSSLVRADAMFQNCNNLQSVNLDNFSFVFQPSGLFSGANSLKTISAKNWKIPNTFTGGFFRSMAGGSSIESIDVTGWDLSGTTDISCLFAANGATGGKGLKNIIGLNTWNTSNIRSMNGLFYGLSSLTTLDLSSFNTSNVTDMQAMFQGASGLTVIDLSSFDTSRADLGGTFVNTNATIGYAKTQADADRLNASGGKPSSLTFTVKTN